MADKDILRSTTKWLNDGIVYAAQRLLAEYTLGNIFGWQSPQCAKKSSFKPIPAMCPFVQILHVRNNHWIVVSNLNLRSVRGDVVAYHDSVQVYDSSYSSLLVSNSTKRTLCSFVKPRPDKVYFELMNTDQQSNSCDCGLYAVACATELAYRRDPVLCVWDVDVMREHLLKCLEKGEISGFPTIKRRRVGLGARIRRSIEVTIYCLCRKPEDEVDGKMIACDVCDRWYHLKCVELDADKDYSDVKWTCLNCHEVYEKMHKEVMAEDTG